MVCGPIGIMTRCKKHLFRLENFQRFVEIRYDTLRRTLQNHIKTGSNIRKLEANARLSTTERGDFLKKIIKFSEILQIFIKLRVKNLQGKKLLEEKHRR